MQRARNCQSSAPCRTKGRCGICAWVHVLPEVLIARLPSGVAGVFHCADQVGHTRVQLCLMGLVFASDRIRYSLAG